MKVLRTVNYYMTQENPKPADTEDSIYMTPSEAIEFIRKHHDIINFDLPDDIPGLLAQEVSDAVA